jgi:hypothetical protein
MKHNLILNYCSWNQNEHVTRLLKSSDIDILYNSGEYFRQAIKHNNVEMLNTLLNYFQKITLQLDTDNKYAVPIAKQKLQQILQDAANSFNPSKEIQEVLEKYLPKEEDSDSEQELEDIIIPTLNAGIITTELTEDSLRKFEAETKEINPTKIIENLLGFDTKEIQHSIEEDTTNINVDLSGDNIQKVH